MLMKKQKKINKRKKVKRTKPVEYLVFVQHKPEVEAFRFANNKDRESFLAVIEKDPDFIMGQLSYATAEKR